MFKSKLGRNVEADMVRFHEEAENFKASLWHLAAINATDTNEELLAHQRAIEMLRVWVISRVLVIYIGGYNLYRNFAVCGSPLAEDRIFNNIW